MTPHRHTPTVPTAHRATPFSTPAIGDAKPLRPGELLEPITFGDFLTGVGELYQLPPRRPTIYSGVPVISPDRRRSTVPGGVPATNDPERRRTLPAGTLTVARKSGRSPWLLPATAVLTLCLTVAWWTVSPPAPVVPPALLGEWTTTHADFAGKQLAFSNSDVLIGVQPNAQAERYVLLSVRSVPEGPAVRVTIAYGDRDAPMELTARLYEGSGRRLVFLRPEGLVWTPVTGIATSN